MSAARPVVRAITARRLGVASLGEVRDFLREDPRGNLLLIDLAARFDETPPPGEMRSELVGVFRGTELTGVAALRPTVVLDSRMEPEAVDAVLPFVEGLEVGLVKCEASRAGRLWSRLSRRGRRRVWVDRYETAYALDRHTAALAAVGDGRTVRAAGPADLEPLVFAARESLREEERPDPFAGDARGFRRWVRGRVPRALLVESRERIRFVGYADVRRPEGWLLQGIYTWPEARRRGHAAAGTSALCREAFAAGAEHVQLAVVDGNEGARRLYEGLGFKPFGRLRTILFT